MNGGEWLQRGIAGQAEFCRVSFPDGGKSCNSSEECKGGCVIYTPPAFGEPTPSVGVCSYDNDPFVCHASINYPEFYACPD